jgi:hypothetical protein
MSLSLRSLQLIVAGTALVLAGGIYRYYRQIRAQPEPPFGHYTSQQIIDRTLPLCQSILGTTDGLRLATNPIQTSTPDGRTRLWWRVDGFEARGTRLVSFLWEAQTGELAFVTNNIRLSVSASTKTWTEDQRKAQAAWLSYRWLHGLGIAQEGSRWWLTREPARSSTRSVVWSTRWRSGDRKAQVQVEVGSGLLVSAKSWPLSGLSPVR